MASDRSDQFSIMAGAIALELLGAPNKSLSSDVEYRFGNKGSLSVDLVKGVWTDHQTNEGGGVLALIERERGLKGREAIAWLKEKGFQIDDNRPAQAGSNRRYEPRNENESAGRDRDDGPPFKAVKTWDYVDETGDLLFQVVRMENGEVGSDGKPKKTYRQRKPDASKRDGWDWSTKGVRQVPYRLPELQESVAQGLIIFITEGEKAADKLIDLGIPATTNARGAGKWVAELNPFFEGARVVVLADDDPQATHPDGRLKFHEDGRPVYVGLDHANAVARNLNGIARDLRVIQLTDRKKKEDVVEWFDQGGEIEDLYEIVRHSKKYEAEPYRSKFNAIKWSALDDPGPQHEFLIKGLLTRGETSIIGGASQAGKSFLIVDIGMAVARGTEWFGRKVKRGGVIYQAGEGQKGIKKRLKAYRIRNGIHLDDDVPFVLMPAQLNLFRDDDPTNAFIEEAKHWASTFSVPLELIIIDTFAKAITGANENDGRDVGQVLERCARISNETGAHVCLVHHMNADGNKLRGHTSILANLENVLIVSVTDGLRDDNSRPIREVLIDKQKDGERGGRIRFVLEQVILGHDEEGDPITSCIVTSASGEPTDQAVPEKHNVTNSEALFVRALQKAIEDGGSQPPAASKLPRSLRVVEWKSVVKAYDALSFDTAETENEDVESRKKRMDARRQAMRRSGESLLKKGIISRDDPWIWLTGRRIRGMRGGPDAPGGNAPPREERSEANYYQPARSSAPTREMPEDAGALWGED